MILSIIGIVLSLLAIGLFFWLKKEQQMNFNLHEGDIEAAKHAYNALMEDLNNFQIETDRKIAELEKRVIKNQQDQNRRVDKIEKDIPLIVRNVIGNIEFAKPLDKK